MDAADEAEAPEGIPIYPMLWWLVPLHALLPVLMGAAISYGGEVGAAAVSWGWVGIHFGFPIFLGLSYPWWRGRGDEVAAVLIINHVVTFTVGAALMTWWAGL